jgi:ribosomal protein S26
MNYLYRYTRSGPRGRVPLARCPACGADLTADRAVRVDCGSVFLSRLSAGVLYDVDDLVRSGQHRGTYCAACDELFINNDGVHETNLNDPGTAHPDERS